ncbi:hypothetical protein BgiBS90_026142 [Biomphalaria glabrata]|nr:hypothetical protein BgiBS90_026142 [Biomphalaria glabrata]
MRLFQSQTLPSEPEQSDPELDLDRKVKLLKQTSHIVKEKGHRVATPDKMAILELASNFEKRKLGKQQQILTDIAKRCQEQEVHDLSARLTTRCELLATPRLTSDSSFYMSKRLTTERLSEFTSDSVMYAGTTVSERPPQEKTYKFFPARNKIRQQTMLHSDLDLHNSDSSRLINNPLPLEQLRSSEASKILLPEKTFTKPFNGFQHRRRHYKSHRGRKAKPLSNSMMPGLNYLYLGFSARGSKSSAALQNHALFSLGDPASHHIAMDEDKKSAENLPGPNTENSVTRNILHVPSIESIGRSLAKSLDV